MVGSITRVVDDEINNVIRERLYRAAAEVGLDVTGGWVRRTSSRFCFGVEHGDYNGTELFGVGTNRYIWLAGKANDSGQVRLFSLNFPAEGVIAFTPGHTPAPQTPSIRNSWTRFPLGADHVLRQAGYPTGQGFDGVLFGNIPGGGMSRSASLSLNLIISLLELNGAKPVDSFQTVELAQAIETEYIGSPCGLLDQVMIYYARGGMGTHYQPGERRVTHVPLGKDAEQFSLVSLDTGTTRPGLEKSTYRIRRQECDHLLDLAQKAGFPITCLADAYRMNLHGKIQAILSRDHPDLCCRLRYLAQAQSRFPNLLSAWRDGDMPTLGAIFRRDGIGLRDDYCISGPELETMCDIARTVPGVLGERMLGGGDKGASGAIVRKANYPDLEKTIIRVYPNHHPDLADKFAVHECSVVDGVKLTCAPTRT